MTIKEGETIIFNCTLATEQSNHLFAVWVIDALQYYYGDFERMRTYTYNLADNSLTVHNVSRRFDGSSFQCIISRHASKTGYVSVQYSHATMLFVTEANSSSCKSVYK